jgi:hypothetical protein
MILTLLQFPTIRLTVPQFFLFIMLPIFIVSEIIWFWISLKIVKAKERKTFKLSALSFAIQAGVLIFINSPFIFFGILGQLGGAVMPYLLLYLPLCVFIEINLINVIHQTGIKKATGVFFLMLIPLVIIMIISIWIMSLVMSATS